MRGAGALGRRHGERQARRHAACVGRSCVGPRRGLRQAAAQAREACLHRALQATRNGVHEQRPERTAARDRPRPASRAGAALLRGPARPRQLGAPPPHERRRTREPPHPSALRRAEGLRHHARGKPRRARHRGNRTRDLPREPGRRAREEFAQADRARPREDRRPSRALRAPQPADPSAHARAWTPREEDPPHLVRPHQAEGACRGRVARPHGKGDRSPAAGLARRVDGGRPQAQGAAPVDGGARRAARGEGRRARGGGHHIGSGDTVDARGSGCRPRAGPGRSASRGEGSEHDGAPGAQRKGPLRKP